MTDLFHLALAADWDEAEQSGEQYYPPTYQQDGFVHATADPHTMLMVANHFYQANPARWVCLRISQNALSSAGIAVRFEAPAPVGAVSGDFSGATGVAFPHIFGGLAPDLVAEVHELERDGSGQFLRIVGI